MTKIKKVLNEYQECKFKKFKAKCLSTFILLTNTL